MVLVVAFDIFEKRNNTLDTLDQDQLVSIAQRLIEENEVLSKRLSAVSEFGIAINQNLDFKGISGVIAKYAKKLIAFEHCSLYLRDEKHTWQLAIICGTARYTDAHNLILTDNVGTAIHTRQSLIIHELIESPFLAEYASQLIVPLISGHEVLGTINFATKSLFAYNDADLEIGYVLASQLAGALRNTRYVSELKMVEYELRHYAQELESRNEELDAFTYTIAHDLKSPLSAIRLKTQLIERLIGDDGDENVRQHLDGTRGVVDHMVTMIDQLMWLAQLRNIEEMSEPVATAPVLGSALSRFEHQIEDNNITLQIGGSLPTVMAHAQWIEEVFANLISNAIKYIGEDNANPRIEIHGWLEGKCAIFEVTDNGIGIPKEQQAQLFEMFSRVGDLNVDGLGLGLSIAHRIIKRLNGEIGVRSASGEGSTFWFTLPAAL